MKWVEPQYSKSKVRRAGEVLVSPDSSSDEKEAAMDILSNWRASHAYPMHAMLIFLRNKSSDIDSQSIVVQRLKRTPSILNKLDRFPGMKLHRMQDIGGCRSVVKTTAMAEKLSEQIQTSRTRHELLKIDNYIETPKDSGYRGIHLIYKYRGAKEQYTNYLVELQIRSRVQHAWATAIEIIDTFTQQALKSSQGHKDWLNFFRYASAEFAILEKRPKNEKLEGVDTFSKTKRLENRLNAINRLDAFAITTQHLEKSSMSKSDYFLLELEADPQVIKITQYPPSFLEQAARDYLALEKRAQKEALFDAVLVSATSINALKTAYPNYFADSKEFVKYLEKILEK